MDRLLDRLGPRAPPSLPKAHLPHPAAGPRALRLQKALIRRWEELPMREAIAAGVDAFAAAWESEEPRQMLGAFAARRRPGA